MGERPHNCDDRAAISRALRLKREVEAFTARWPNAARKEDILPTFTWDQLERQLTDLAATPAQASMASHLVSATRKLAPFKPSEMVLREILCMTWVLLDENFKPDSAEGSLETNSDPWRGWESS